MGQMDRIREDIAAIAEAHAGPDVVRREVQKRIERFITDAKAFYEGEPDGNAQLRKDLSRVGDMLLVETEKGLPAALAKAFDYAFEVVSEKLHARRNGT